MTEKTRDCLEPILIDLATELLKIYDVTEDPKGEWGWIYHCCLILSNVIYMVIILIETADGPNYYVGYQNKSLYYQLPTFEDYLIIKMVFSIPLMLHCIGRICIAIILHGIAIFCDDENLSTPFFTRVSNYLLSIWFWPLVINSIKPGIWPLQYMAFYHIIDFLRHVQILQSFKRVPSFLVVKETFRRVVKLVPIPVFIFFCFNIF